MKNKVIILPVPQVVYPNTISFYVGDVQYGYYVDVASKIKNEKVYAFVSKVKDKSAYNFVDINNIHNVGCVAEIDVNKDGDLRVRVLYRAKLVEVNGYDDKICYGEVEDYPYTDTQPSDRLEVLKSLMDKSIDSLNKLKKTRENIFKKYYAVEDINDKINAALEVLDGVDRQLVLEESSTIARAEMVCVLAKETINNIGIMEKIDNIVEERMKQGQKEFFLREQVRAIKSELGEDEEEYDIMRDKIENLATSDDVKEKLLKEVSRMEKMPTNSPEYSMLCNYMDIVLSLPWGVYSQDNFDIDNVREVLDCDHYGIERVKDRIVEYIAVRKLAPDSKAPILCLVGAPGVGKTSIAQSIAKAIGKEYVHMSLGGIRDEAEIRGHRKTYIGAMPGRIMSQMSKAKTSNPMFLLDEIDKMKSDMRGDPSSAMLEVLDPNQNHSFRDTYLEIPYDLSKVMFVMTANTLSTIQKPLLDRMEVIEMDSYTIEEKVEIGDRYLVPKQIKEHGLEDCEVEISKDALFDVVDYYTKEAGVRELERQIGKICRKIATDIVSGNSVSHTVNCKNLAEYLGVRKYDKDDDIFSGQVGVVNGLAWTSVGGVVMNIESRLLPSGKGEITLTGSLGDVMKESARISMSVVRSILPKLNIDGDILTQNDIHIHAPEGATPKDGPSAGISMATCLLSTILNKPIKPHLAMTGELTLSGKVLAIGGLKEKLLAAIRSGMKEVIVPKQNQKNMEDMPSSVKEKLDIHFVEDISQVFDIALGVKI